MNLLVYIPDEDFNGLIRKTLSEPVNKLQANLIKDIYEWFCSGSPQKKYLSSPCNINKVNFYILLPKYSIIKNNQI